jgi:hypothetical protein
MRMRGRLDDPLAIFAHYAQIRAAGGAGKNKIYL